MLVSAITVEVAQKDTNFLETPDRNGLALPNAWQGAEPLLRLGLRVSAKPTWQWKSDAFLLWCL